MRDPVRTRSAAPEDVGDELVIVSASDLNAKAQPPAPFHVIRVVRWHRCEAQHKTFNRFARCAFRHTVWVAGEGPFATVSQCVGWRPGYEGYCTVMLHPTEELARRQLAFIDQTACGGGCSRQHRLVRLVMS